MATFPANIARVDLVDHTLADAADINPNMNEAYDTINALINGCNNLNAEVAANDADIAALETGVDDEAALSRINEAWGRKWNLLVELGGTPDEEVDVTAGALGLVNVADATDWILLTDVSETLDISLQWPGDVNGREAGTALAANTWYSLWIIYNSTTDTVAGLISDDATAPTMPADYDYRRRIGWVVTDATSDIQHFRHIPDSDLWLWTPDSGRSDKQVLNITKGGGWNTVGYADVDCSSLAPPTCRRIDCLAELYLEDDGGASSHGTGYFREKGTNDTDRIVTAYAWLANEEAMDSNYFTIGCDSSQTIQYQVGDTGNLHNDSWIVCWVMGYYDPI